MLSAPNTTALAATGTKISSVPLSIESEIVVGDIDDVVITNEPSDEWDDGDKPKFKITLYADDDYYFASGFSKSSVSLSGSDGTVTSVSRSASDTLIVYSSYITKSGYYTFKVRGVYSTSDKGSWKNRIHGMFHPVKHRKSSHQVLQREIHLPIQHLLVLVRG